MSRRHLLAALITPMMLLGAACGSEEETPRPEETTAAPTEEPEPEPEPSAGLPPGEGSGSVALQVDLTPLPGDDWTTVCSEDDGAISFSATATPLSTVQLETDADGNVTRFVASGEDYGPFTADGPAAEDLEVTVGEATIEIRGAIEAGPVAASLTCPA